MYLDICVDVCTPLHVCGVQRLMLNVFLKHSPTYFFFFETFSLNLELTSPARLFGQLAPGILPVSSSLGLRL